MDASGQDPLAEIERALAALQHARPRGPGGPRGPHGAFSGPPFGPMGAPHGMRGPHGRMGAARIRLLAALREREGLSVSELSAAVGVDQPRASRLVNDAAEHGLVVRQPDPQDARRIVVRLTATGRTLLESFEARRRSQVSAALAGFTPDETAALAHLLRRFTDALAAARQE